MTGLPTSFPFTDEWIATLPAPDKETLIHDTICDVLALRCRPNGSKSFYFFSYEWVDHRRMRERQMRRPIGSPRAMTCDEARKLAKRALEMPWLLDRTPRPSPKMPLSQIIDHYVSSGLAGNARHCFSPETAAHRAKSLSQHLGKLQGQRKLSSLSRAELMTYFERLSLFRPSEAHHAHKAAKAFLNWCADIGLVPANPLAKSSLSWRSRSQARTLTVGEIACIYLACGRLNHVTAQLYCFAIVAACDIKEARLTTTREVRFRVREGSNDPLDPAARQLLPDSALALISSGQTSGWCFPSPRRPELPISVSTEIVRRIIASSNLEKPWTTRDLVKSVKLHAEKSGGLLRWNRTLQSVCEDMSRPDVAI